MSDSLVDLEALLEELPDAVDRRKLGDRLKRTVEALRGADHQIGRVNAVFELADMTGLCSANAQSEVLEQLKTEAYEIGGAFQTAATEDELRDAVYDYERSFPPVLATAERTVRAQWGSIASSKFRSIELLGELLKRIGVAPELAQRLQDCAARGLASNAGGQLTDLVPRVRALLAELDELQEERAKTISDGDVGTFINALAENRATLAMVTPEVQAWLVRNQALDRFGIIPR